MQVSVVSGVKMIYSDKVLDRPKSTGLQVVDLDLFLNANLILENDDASRAPVHL